MVRFGRESAAAGRSGVPARLMHRRLGDARTADHLRRLPSIDSDSRFASTPNGIFCCAA